MSQLQSITIVDDGTNGMNSHPEATDPQWPMEQIKSDPYPQLIMYDSALYDSTQRYARLHI